MSSYKPVTTAQAECLRKVAKDKQVGRARFQQALDDGSLARYLDSLKVGVGELVPPPGCRIHVVRVRVKQNRPWQDAINAAGPNTPDNYNVRKVGDQYVPASDEEVEKDIILLNYPKGDGGWDKGLAWAKGAGLNQTNPREVFAIGEQHPTLHETLGINPMYVVATTECAFEGHRLACRVWWGGSDREAYLYWVSRVGRAIAWVAFSK